MIIFIFFVIIINLIMSVITKNIKFFYDEYEKSYGDGFYPQLKKCETCAAEINIEFKEVWIEKWGMLYPPLPPNFWKPNVWETWDDVEEYRGSGDAPEFFQVIKVWKQMNGDAIKGLDGSCGNDLFEVMKGTHDNNGIVNLNCKIIYTPPGNREVFYLKRLITSVEEAENRIRKETAIPYVLGGNCAKYQGLDKTLEYLKISYPEVFSILSNERINEIISQTIIDEQT